MRQFEKGMVARVLAFAALGSALSTAAVADNAPPSAPQPAPTHIVGANCQGSPTSIENYDANGYLDGPYMQGSCTPSGVVVNISVGFVHGVPDGPFHSYNCVFTSDGYFDHGRRIGDWKFALKKTPGLGCLYADGHTSVTPLISLGAGNGPWNLRLDGEPLEVGYVKDGYPEGRWQFGSYLRAGPGRAAIAIAGAYHLGVADGVWEIYDNSPSYQDWSHSLRATVTMRAGYPSGPFINYHAQTGERIEGTLSGGLQGIGECFTGWDLTPWLGAGRLGLPSIPSNGTLYPRNHSPPLKMSGTWRFYDRSGRLLGSEDLGAGDQRMTIWDAAGDKYCEGNLVEGLPDGDWTLYQSGRPTLLLGFAKGFETGARQDIPILPPQ